MGETMPEIIVYKDYGRIIRWQPSDENGVFRDNVRLDTGSDEGPRLMIYSAMYGFDKVRVMDDETKRQFLELQRQIDELTKKRNEFVEANWDKMPSVTWEYMKQHQQPNLPVLEPYKHKNAITALRRGNKVLVDGSTDAVRWRIACKIGKLKKKGPKNALVQIEGEERLWRIPYHVLLPYSYQTWLSEKRRAKHSEKLNRMSRQVSRALNKML
jgi:hypothetical protein